MGPFFRQEFVKWIISNVSVEEMYKTVNRIDGLVFPE